jgi:hypothetical protein
MNEQRWEEVLKRLDRLFGDLEFDEVEDEESHSVVESVVWTSPQGRMKLTRTTRPLVIDKKTHFSSRIGGGTHVEYVYSTTESTSRVRLYRWDEPAHDWEEVDASSLGAPSASGR